MIRACIVRDITWPLERCDCLDSLRRSVVERFIGSALLCGGCCQIPELCAAACQARIVTFEETFSQIGGREAHPLHVEPCSDPDCFAHQRDSGVRCARNTTFTIHDPSRCSGPNLIHTQQLLTSLLTNTSFARSTMHRLT